MDDITLAGYIPTYGDRIAARRICLENKGTAAKESRKYSLLEKLKRKMGIKGKDNSTSDYDETSAPKWMRSYAKNNKSAKKGPEKLSWGGSMRVNPPEEMSNQFKDSVLLKHPLKYTCIDEKGADVDGVSRDVYAAFWMEFIDHTAEGEDMRVPSLSPKWQEE